MWVYSRTQLPIHLVVGKDLKCGRCIWDCEDYFEAIHRISILTDILHHLRCLSQCIANICQSKELGTRGEEPVGADCKIRKADNAMARTCGTI